MLAHTPRNEFWRKRDHKRVHHYGKPAHGAENAEPDTNPLSPLCYWSAEVNDEINGIYAKFQDIVDECKQRCQGKCSHEHGNKTKLDYWT